MNEVNILKSGTILIYGDIDKEVETVIVENSTYDEDTDSLTINFDKGKKCIISKPEGVVNSEDYFCIKEAEYVQWFYPVNNIIMKGVIDKIYKISEDCKYINILESSENFYLGGRHYKNDKYEALEIF